MIKLSFEKLKKKADLLHRTIRGINSIQLIRNQIESELSDVIEPNVAKAIFNGTMDIFSLSNEEMFSFLDLLYKKIKDEKLNPFNYKQTEAKEVNIGKTLQKMWNSEFKERFLEEHDANGKGYSDETKRVARSLFGQTAKLESYNEQDLYEFNRHSFEAVLTALEATTIRSLQSSISTIEQYIDFAIKNGKIDKSRGNVASKYSKKEEISRFLNKDAEENMFFSKHEIDSLAEYAENAQDGVILNLIFDGVNHKNRFLELRNIKIQDCDFHEMVINIPELTDENTGEAYPSRQVPISSHTKMMIERAMDHDEKYVSLKGNSSRKYKIAVSDYILRGLRDNIQIKWENVAHRIIRISEVSGYRYLNATNIAYSGQVHYANLLMKEEGYSLDDAVDAIIKRFNISDNESSFYYLKSRIDKVNLNK